MCACACVIGLAPLAATAEICEYITATIVIEPQDPDDFGIDNFGYSIAKQGDFLIAGSPMYANNGTVSDGGAARRLRREGDVWQADGFMYDLFGDPPLDGDRHGTSVAIVQNSIIVGAPGQYTGASGLAYAVKYQGGDQNASQMLWPPGGSPDDAFGQAIAAVGTTLAIGAPGAARVHLYNQVGLWGGGWIHSLILEPPDPCPGYARSLGGHDSLLIIGAAESDRAFLADASTNWTQQELIPDDPGYWIDTQFGDAVAVTQTTDGALWAFVGAPAEWLDSCLPGGGFPHDESGAVVVFAIEDSTWVEHSILRAPDCESDGFFGTALAAAGNRLLIGADGAAAAYIAAYVDADWVMTSRVEAAGAGNNSLFGGSVALEEVVADVRWEAVIGAPAENNGLVYFVSTGFTSPDTDCDGDGSWDACQILGNPLLDCDDNWSLDACQIEDTPDLDCDDSGVLDECELPAGVLADCNGNGVSDICEIVAAPTIDCNGSMMPDECEITRGVSTHLILDDSGSVGELFALQVAGVTLAVCPDPRHSPILPTNGDNRLSLDVFDEKDPGTIAMPPRVLSTVDDSATFCHELNTLGQAGIETVFAPALLLAIDLFEATPADWDRTVIVLSDGDFAPSDGWAQAAEELRTMTPPIRICAGKLALGDPGVCPQYGPHFENMRQLANAPDENGGQFDPHQPVGVIHCIDEPADVVALCRECQFHWAVWDCNQNGVPDSCETDCEADLDASGGVGTDDLLLIISNWGSCTPPPDSCSGDATCDGEIDANDILLAISQWGGCSDPGPGPPRSQADCIDRFGAGTLECELCFEALVLMEGNE